MPLRLRVGEKIYSDYPAAPYVSGREWVAFIFLVTGLALYAGAIVAGVAWVIWKLVRLWL